MGFYFRRSIKAGPVRINFSKNGIGWSFGNKVARIGRSATGKNYVSGGAAGVYYRETLPSGNKQVKSNTRRNQTQTLGTTTRPQSEFTASGCFFVLGFCTILVISPLFGLLCWSWKVFFILFGSGFGLLLLSMLSSKKASDSSNDFFDEKNNINNLDPAVASFVKEVDEMTQEIYQMAGEAPIHATDERIDQTAEYNNKGMEYESNNEIDKAIECYEQVVKLGYPAIYAYDRLLILYKKLGKNDDEIRIAKCATSLFPQETKYLKRLKKLEGNEDPVVLPQVAIIAHPRVIYGDKFEEVILKLPEFDFYSKGTDNYNYYRSLVSQESLKPVWEIQRHFKQLLESAKTEEDYNNLAGAAAIYEQIAAEKYWMPAPYDSLIKIYAKAKLKEDEKRILVMAINHFKQLKECRFQYVKSLAEKNNATDLFNERVNADKKITYFNGVFELYNPFTVIPKWEERLNKISK